MAGRRLVEQLEGETEPTEPAGAVVAHGGRPSAGSPFLGGSERIALDGTVR